MRVSPQALQEFKDIYLQEYGVELDDETAQKKAIGVLKAIRIVYRPFTKPIGGGGEIDYGKNTTQNS